MANFEQLNSTSLYLATGATQASARVAYVVVTGDTPPTFSLADSLTNTGGVYLFFTALPQDAADLATFIGAVQDFVTAPGREGTRFVWFTDTAQVNSGQILRLNADLTTADPIDYIFQNYDLRLLQGNTVGTDGPETGLVFKAPAGSPNLLVVSPQGINPNVDFEILTDVSLPLQTTDTPGCFSFTVQADHEGTDNLDIGLRYFMTSAEDPQLADTLRYPVLDLTPPPPQLAGGANDAIALQLSAVFDPVDQLNAGRTYLTISSLAATGGGAASAIRSYYLNPVGQQLRLAPGASAKLIFNTLVQFAPVQDGNPVPQPYYFAPSGDFTVTPPSGASGNITANVMCGVSAVEYVALDNAGTTVLTFSPNADAYSDATYNPDPVSGEPKVQFSPLSSGAQTSWAWLSSPVAPLGYFAQPVASVLYVPPAAQGAGDANTPAFLNYGPMKAGGLSPLATLAPGAPGERGFPMAPYQGTQGQNPLTLPQLELQVLAPTRRSLIPPVPVSASQAVLTTPSQGTTPQGLLLNLKGTGWQGLTLAQSSIASDPSWVNVNPPAGGYPPVYNLADSDQALILYDVSGPFQAALQSSVLFLVASNGAKFLNSCSIPYVVTQLVLDELLKQANLPQAVVTALAPLINNTYASVATFQTALQGVLSSGDYQLYGATIISYCADFQMVVQGFQFDLSPYLWDRNSTMLLIKYQNATLGELVQDTSKWSHANDLNDSPDSIQSVLVQYIQDARNSTDPAMQEFINDIVDNKNWNGILAINVQVPLTGLPPELEGLAAGIDPALFLAHHIGATVTPVIASGSTLVAKPSSIFGLINYPDQGPIVDTVSAYQYKVRTLKMVMENSSIASFSSVVELLVNQLFGDGAVLQGATSNTIDFNGVYQKQGTQGTYLFTNDSVNVFKMTSNILDTVVISGAQFVTVGEVTQPDKEILVESKFLFSGFINFLAQPGFDAFSFGDDKGKGGLAFSNLSVDLSFDKVIPSYKTFAFDAAGITLDTGTSMARADSLYSHFPLKLTALSSGGGDSRPDKANFMPVGTPLSSGGLSDTWYALSFSLNLGTPGALAAQVGFDAGFIVAWSPGTSQLSLYIGLSLPGVKGGERAITLQGVIKLTFGDVSFMVNGTSYILQMRNIALSILSLTIPPSGQTNILLFGDPSGADRDTLGWYACFVKSGGSGGGKTQMVRLPGLTAESLAHVARLQNQVVRIDQKAVSQ